MKLSKRMLEIAEDLEARGHSVVLPRHTKEYVQLGTSDHIHNESVKNKINNDLIRDYYNEIKNNDAILVVNEDLNGIKNYIGGNSFLEMGFAHVLNKEVFLLNEIPDTSYKDEIVAIKPIILKRDLNKIK